MKRETILVVDDDPDIVKLLRSYLERDGYSVLTAANGDAALQRIHQEQPDCVILDLMLPGQDGWSVTRAVRTDERVRDIPIIMLTARVDDTDKIVGLELGADDYVTKPFNPREIVARVRVQLRHAQKGGASAVRGVYTAGGLRLDANRRRVLVGDDEINLTATEFDILQTFMQNAGSVFTRDELIEQALGYAFAGLGRTVDSHIKNLRAKIEPNPREPIYIVTIYGVGYRFADGVT